jgi:hypothetical protein
VSWRRGLVVLSPLFSTWVVRSNLDMERVAVFV